MRARTWRRARQAIAILLVLALGGAIVAVSGVIPISASSGHWRITAALLELAKRRSVSTHTLGAEPLPLDEPWLVQKGAAHYETGCRPCHGGPGSRRPVVADAMTPQPPDLRSRVASWEPEELFYIVRHGMKFTGMPGWPAPRRDDEVRAMVAFLLELPKLDAAAYRRLAQIDVDAGDAAALAPFGDLNELAPPLVASCGRCHGLRGEGRGSAAFPKLAGQSREYLVNALEAYAGARRASGIMQPVAAALSPGERLALASYYSRQRLDAAPNAAYPPAALDRGREIALFGIRAQGVPSCVDCHGPGRTSKNPAYPRLAGQYADYLALELELFKKQARGGSSYAHIMSNVAARLQPGQMRDVARYYASLSGASRADPE